MDNFNDIALVNNSFLCKLVHTHGILYYKFPLDRVMTTLRGLHLWFYLILNYFYGIQDKYNINTIYVYVHIFNSKRLNF